MAELIEHILNDQLLIFATPVFLLTMIIELYLSQRRNLELYHKQDSLTSMALGFIALVVEIGFKLSALFLFTQLHDMSPWRDVVARQWWAVVILFFLDDFSYYWFHRMNHQVRLFWAGHVNHHSSVRFNYATALRQGVGERAHKYIYWLWHDGDDHFDVRSSYICRSDSIRHAKY